MSLTDTSASISDKHGEKKTEMSRNFIPKYFFLWKERQQQFVLNKIKWNNRKWSSSNFYKLRTFFRSYNIRISKHTFIWANNVQSSSTNVYIYCRVWWRAGHKLHAPFFRPDLGQICLGNCVLNELADKPNRFFSEIWNSIRRKQEREERRTHIHMV